MASTATEMHLHDRDLIRRRSKVSPAQLGRWITYGILTVITLFYLYPFWWILGGSLKTRGEFFSRPLALIPEGWVFQNYVDAWNKAQFGGYFFNTVYVCAGVVIFVNLFAGMAGFSFGRTNFPGKKLLQTIIIVTMFLPAGYTIIPIYDLMIKLHLTNTREVLIVLGTAGNVGLYTFFYWGYFSTLPKELEEAAIVDGANFWRMFWNVMFPLARPMTATVTLMTFLNTWNDFFTPLIFTMRKPELRTLAIGMYAFMGEHSRDWTPMLAATVITLIPIILVFLFLQRYFVEAIAGAVK